MRICKFGGSSVGSPDAIRRVADIIKKKQGKDKLVVVVSAFRGITDQLLELANKASKGDQTYENHVEEIDKRHLLAIRDLIQPGKQSDVITRHKLIFNELEDILHGVFLTRELTRRSTDFILGFGERFSAQILNSYLNDQSVISGYVDTRTLIKTDKQFGEARVQAAETFENIRHYVSNSVENVLVATGFISSTQNGESTTLGRGGSDYTASLFGAALQADMIEIWTDVDGLLTADPGKVERAFSVDYASYEEAMELSHFGAKVIYPPTIQPALKAGIPIHIKNTFYPERPGTKIQQEPEERGGLIRGLSSIDNVALITIKGSGMIGVSGVASRIFSALARHRINIILITQASSEHTVCFAVLPNQAQDAKTALEEEFSDELHHEVVDEIRIENNLSIIAIVGDSMREIPGIAGRVFSALGRNGINITAIAQGSSERNISFVVDRKNERKAMNTLHDAFFLAGVKSVNLFMIGIGLIGGTLLKLIHEQLDDLYNNYQIDVRFIGLANSKSMLIGDKSIPADNWKDIFEKQSEPMDLSKFTDTMISLNLPNSVFIDCTASADVPSVYEKVLQSSISIVTPNKKANSASQDAFNSLHQSAIRHNCAFRYETNAGAGLPIVATIHEMQTTGDKIEKIEGVFSGTLSYLFNNFNGSVPFSELVNQAREKGFTEPDPREDLNGLDVARKLLILARVAGYELELSDISIQNLVPKEARKTEDIDSFFDVLKKYDDKFETMRTSAKNQGKKLCYIAVFEKENASVKLEKIDDHHPFYGLSGSDNIIAITSRHYRESPMVIKGPGAGANVTAGGIIADILRVANTKAYSNAGY